MYNYTPIAKLEDSAIELNGLLKQTKKLEVDGTIGNTTQDGFIATYIDYNYHDKFTPTTAGVVGYGHIYLSIACSGDTICLSLCSSDGTCLAYGTTTGETEEGWTNVAMDTTVSINSETTYYLSFQGGDACALGTNSGGTEYYFDSDPYDCDGNIDNPEETPVSDYDITIYFDNNAGDPT